MGVSVDVNREVKLLWGSGRGWGFQTLGGQGGCERRIEVFVKIQKKKKFFWRGGQVRGGGELGGVGSGVGLGGGGVREDVTEK